MKTLKMLVLAGLCLAGLSASGGAAHAQTNDLQKQVLEQAPAIMAKLQEKGYQNVGVLKFRVKKGDQPVSDNVGTLNMLLADQMEAALILANSNDLQKQIGITRRASNVAAKLRGINYSAKETRAALFEAEYPLAWGTAKVKPDAFITGFVVVDANLKQMKVIVSCFDKDTETIAAFIPAFTAKPDAATLGEMGESFVLRGGFDKGSLEVASAKEAVKELEKASEKAVEKAAEVKTKADDFPLTDKDAQVTMEVLYDGKPIAVDTTTGKASILEPNENQKVVIVVKRVGAAKNRLAIVVKVNGENTLFREKLRDIDCRKWIMEKEMTTITIGGFQMSEKQREDFRVASKEESKTREVDFGEDVGTITMSVFAEKTTNDPPPDLPLDTKEADKAEDLAALTRGVFPKETPKNLAALKHQLREGGKSGTRGLVLGGNKTDFAIKKVEFKTDPTPVMSVVVTYYKP